VNPTRANQRGVTLLEALIAVALLAALATMLSPAVYGAMRMSSAVLGAAGTREQRRTVDDALTAILSNAVVMTAADADMMMRGDAKSLQAVSLAGSGVARRFLLTIDGGRLSGEIAPLIDDERGSERVEIVSEGALRFSYYGRASENAPLAWTGQWRNARPPAVVRFEMAAEKADATDLVFDIYVAAAGPLHCEFDPVSRRCRS
jgi:prepilin-type N-terminal cleavage/methylation domain-containing protein